MIKKALAGGVIAAAIAGAAWWSQRNDDRLHAEEHLQGVVELDERALSLEVGGRIEKVHVARGDAVRAGQLLVELDDDLERTARAARAAEADALESQTELVQAGARPEQIRSMAARVKSAKATEDNLHKTLERERKLLEKRVSTEAAVDDLESRLAAARANRQSLEHELAALRRGSRPEEVETARARAVAAAKTLELSDERVQRYALRAPIAGTILDVHVESGEVIGAGVPVVTLADTKRPYVDVFVPIDGLDGIKVGTSGSVRVDSSPDAFPAHVDWISRQTEFTPRYLFSERERPNLVVRVRLIVDDPSERLHAGVPAFARLDLPARP